VERDREETRRDRAVDQDVEAMSIPPAPGDVWVACTECYAPVELSRAIESDGRRICPACAAGV
jgi:formylmethanofuran dehydrogenase subunit E